MNLNSMNKSGSFLIVLLFIICSFRLVGANGDLANLRNVTIADGLSGNMVDVIYPDSAGYVWIGTEAGVDRFDGNHIVSYSLPEELKEEGCRFYDLIEMPGGRLFAASVKGLFEIDKKGNSLKEVKLSTPVEYVRDLSMGENGKTLWAAGKDGLYEINTETFEAKKILIEKNALSKANDIRGVHYDRNRKGVWVVSKSNVSFYDVKTGKISTYKSHIKDKFQSVTGHGDMLYMSTRESGVCRFDKRTCTFQTPLNFGNNIIMSVKSTSDGRLIVAVDCDGIYIYSIEEQRILNHYDTLNTEMPSNSVYYALIDKRGVLWIGYYQAGLGYTPIVSPFLELYSTPIFPELKHKEVRAMGIEPGYKLIGTRRGLYFIDENLGKGIIFTRPQIQSDVIFSIHKWKGLYYIGTYRGGIYTFNPTTQTLSPITSESGMKNHTSCWDIVEDGKGNLWFGTSSGIHILDSKGNWKKYNSRNSQLLSGNVYCIFFDSTGRGWVASDKGLSIWNGKEFRSNCFPVNFYSNRKYQSIYEDSRHNLYFMPMRGDVFKSNLELTEFSTLNLDEEKKLVVNSMTESGSGRLLLGTNMGLGYLEKNKFNLFNNKSAVTNSIFMVGKPVRYGNITWMGNGIGLVKLDHNKEKKYNQKGTHPLYITVLKTENETPNSMLKPDQSIESGRVKIKGNELEVGVSDFSYVNPELTEIEYILDGVQKKWKIIPANQMIHLENLPGGSSTLRIRLKGEPESEINLQIDVQSNNILIYVGIILILGASTAYLLYLRRRKKRQQEDDKIKKRYVSSRISEEECSRLYEEIEKVMQDKKPYLNPEFKIQDLANMVGSSSFALSYVFNQYLKTGYLNYVNGYRVEEFKRIIAEEESLKFTLTGIALKCGFSSRASFFRHFKSATGLTPSQYIKEHHS